MEKKEPKIEDLQREIDGLKRANEFVAKEALLNSRIIKLLVAAGFITDEKVQEAKSLLVPL